MKNYRFPLVGLSLLLLLVSCKKEDVRKTDLKTDVSATTPKTQQWNTLTGWENVKTENVSTYFSKLADSSITADVVNAGLVLVFKKSGDNIQSLPFQEGNTKTFWYYQVSKGSVRINSDNSTGQNLSSQLFSYFIITPEKLSTLESSGQSTLDLLQLSYDQASALLK